MSQAVFPALPGLAWDVRRSPQWSTLVQTTASGKEVRATYYSAPVWKWTLTYEFLRADTAYLELQTLLGFFNARQGRFDTFLFTDPDDNTVSAQPFGTGDGSTHTFQLVRAWGGFTEPVTALNGNPSIFVNGALKTLGTDFTLGANGTVTFTTAPATAAALTWSGAYYWRVRFDLDTVEASAFMQRLYELKTITFVSVK